MLRYELRLKRTVGMMGIAVLLAGAPVGTAMAVDDGAKSTRSSAAQSDLPSAKDLFKAAIEAQGGQEAFDKIESSSFKAEMETPMGKITMESHNKVTGEFYVRQSLPQGAMRSGFNGDVGWTHNSMQGYQLMNEAQVTQMRSMNVDPNLLPRLQKEFGEMKTAERTSFAGKDAYRVEMVHKESGQRQSTYFDADSKQILGFQIDDSTGDVVVRLEEFKEFGDLTLFSKMVIEQMGMEMVMHFTEITFNEVDDDQFTLPDEVKQMVERKRDE